MQGILSLIVTLICWYVVIRLGVRDGIADAKRKNDKDNLNK